jgi:hypothetical protein
MAATVCKRSKGSYYVRLFFSQQEIWLSLRTKNSSIARLRGAVLRVAWSSAKLTEAGGQGMTRTDMKRIVQEYVRDIART